MHQNDNWYYEFENITLDNGHESKCFKVLIEDKVDLDIKPVCDLILHIFKVQSHPYGILPSNKINLYNYGVKESKVSNEFRMYRL